MQCAIIFTSRLADVHCNIALLLPMLLLPICTFIDDSPQTEPALGPATQYAGAPISR